MVEAFGYFQPCGYKVLGRMLLRTKSVALQRGGVV